jgi:hypothetical protein
LASAKDRELHDKEAAGLRSIGRLFHEPIWVFTRGDLPLESLRDLKNKKILVGGEQTATRRISMQLLKANGVDAANATLLEAMLSSDASQLLRGEADAAIDVFRTGFLVLALGMMRMPVPERFGKQTAMGWHTYLDMFSAVVCGETPGPRDPYMQRNAARYGVDLSKLAR